MNVAGEFSDDVLRQYADILRVGRAIVNDEVISWNTQGSAKDQLDALSAAVLPCLRREPELRLLDDVVKRRIVYWFCKAISINYIFMDVLRLIEKRVGVVCTIDCPQGVAKRDVATEYSLKIIPGPFMRASIAWSSNNNVIHRNPSTGKRTSKGSVALLQTKVKLPPEADFVPSYLLRATLKQHKTNKPKFPLMAVSSSSSKNMIFEDIHLSASCPLDVFAVESSRVTANRDQASNASNVSIRIPVKDQLPEGHQSPTQETEEKGLSHRSALFTAKTKSKKERLPLRKKGLPCEEPHRKRPNKQQSTRDHASADASDVTTTLFDASDHAQNVGAVITAFTKHVERDARLAPWLRISDLHAFHHQINCLLLRECTEFDWPRLVEDPVELKSWCESLANALMVACEHPLPLGEDSLSFAAGLLNDDLQHDARVSDFIKRCRSPVAPETKHGMHHDVGMTQAWDPEDMFVQRWVSIASRCL